MEFSLYCIWGWFHLAAEYRCEPLLGGVGGRRLSFFSFYIIAYMGSVLSYDRGALEGILEGERSCIDQNYSDMIIPAQLHSLYYIYAQCHNVPCKSCFGVRSGKTYLQPPLPGTPTTETEETPEKPRTRLTFCFISRGEFPMVAISLCRHRNDRSFRS